MAKLPHSNYTVEDALEIEKFGKNVITNLEDSSPESGQLVKYQEQRKMLMEKKQAIRSKVKATLEESRLKMRSHSTLAAKQSLAELYNVSSPVEFYLCRAAAAWKWLVGSGRAWWRGSGSGGGRSGKSGCWRSWACGGGSDAIG